MSRSSFLRIVQTATNEKNVIVICFRLFGYYKKIIQIDAFKILDVTKLN